MVLGIGVDLCSVHRMGRHCDDLRFLERVFTEEERRYGRGPQAWAHYAGAFAAKEAFAKASGLGLAKVGLQSLSVGHDEAGRPRLTLADRPALARFGRCRIHLSISHDGDYAVAMVVIEE